MTTGQTMPKVTNFLIVFDHAGDGLLQAQDLGEDVEAALLAYRDAEGKFRSHRQVEVVLVAADSIETVRATHANYFDAPVVGSRYLLGI